MSVWITVNCRLQLAAAALFSALLLAVMPASAQSTGTVLGVARDASGAVVPGAAITVTNAETGASRSVTTGADGAYRVPALPVGHYDMKADKSGFVSLTQRGLNLEVAQELVVNATLQVGAVNQEIQVSGEAPLVDTTTSSLGSVVNERRMSDLPLNGRNYVDLTLLQPGVVVQSTNVGQGAAGTWFSANGAPIRSNNYMLDGAPMVNGLGAGTSSETGTTLGVDGIREYKIVTSAFSAEYGLAMGSQMVIVSKNGGNHVHGDIFEYLRNSALDARNFFDSSQGSGGRRLPEFQRNNIGGAFGGPLRKDKTFFYGVYEGLHQNLGVTIIDSVLPAACHDVTKVSGTLRLTNPSACAATLSANSAVAPAVVPFLNLYPSPNLPGNQYTFPTSSHQDVHWGQMRVDQNFSAGDTLFVRYTIDDGALNNATSSGKAVASGTGFPGNRLAGTSRNQFGTVSESHIFSPTLLNTVRLSVSRMSFGQYGVSSSPDLTDPTYALVTGQPMGQIAISGGITAQPGLAQGGFQNQTVYSLSDDVYLTKGSHAMKFGMMINRYNLNNAFLITQGSATFSNVASFMQGIYTSYTAETPGSNMPRFWAYKTLGFYGQDDYRVNSRLTLNLGIRYEPMTVPAARYGLESRFLNFGDPTQTFSLGPIMRNPTKLNFSPRVGFAWDVTGKGKTAIRGAFGIYEDVGTIGAALQQQAFAMPPFSAISTVGSNPTNTVITFPLPFSAANVGNTLKGMYYDLGQPHSIQYNISIQQQLPLGVGLMVSYVGNRGAQLWQTKEGNPELPTMVNGVQQWLPFLCGGQPSAVTCAGAAANPAYRRINPNWGSWVQVSTGSSSWYNSLQFALNKRLSHGLQVQGTYAFSKALDTPTGIATGIDCVLSGELQGADPLQPSLDKGPSCNDQRQVVHVNVLYHLPDVKSNNIAAKLLKGWWVGSIVTATSGFPFTPVLTQNRSNSGVLTNFADRLNVGTDNTSATFACSGSASAFPGAPACNGGSVTYQYVPYNASTVITGDPNMWFNPLMFRLAPTGTLGQASRGLLRGPGLATWDASINKDTNLPRLGEAAKLQFRFEIFNLLNRANFSTPSGSVFSGALTDPAGASEAPIANVGKITSTATNSRQIQLALKLIF